MDGFTEQERLQAGGAGSRIRTDCRICGDFRSEADLRLEGIIEGDVLAAGRLFVARGAAVRGGVRCGELFLEGEIAGDACVSGMAVLGGEAVIRGRLTAAALEITPGARIAQGLRFERNVRI